MDELWSAAVASHCFYHTTHTLKFFVIVFFVTAILLELLVFILYFYIL